LRDAQRVVPAAKEWRIEVPVLKPSEFTRAEALIGRAEKMTDRLRTFQQAFGAEASRLASALAMAKPVETSGRVVRVQQIEASAQHRPERSPLAGRRPGAASVGSGGLRRILVALAQRPQGLTLRQIGVRAGLSSRSGTFSTYMSRARQSGWVADRGGVTTITDVGLKALGSYEPLPEGPGLLDYWLRELGDSGAARILRAATEAYPNALSLDEVGQRADLNPRSGTFSTYLSRLRSLELIEGRGEIRASAELFS
jgi:hypothetical protein